MEFRIAGELDIPLLSEMEEKYFINPWTKEQYEYEIKENQFSKTLLAFDNNEFIGYINYWILFDNGEINKICVREDYRRRGVGSLLLELAIKDFQDNECFLLSLEVRKSNIKAQNLYEKFGFQKVLVKEAYYSDGEDAFYMIKGAY